MRRSQLINKLRREGYAATVGRVRQAIMNGYLEPLPNKRARGAYDFRPEHLTQLRWYLVHVRPGPQPYATEQLRIRGSNDRVHRHEIEKRRRAARRHRLAATDRTIAWLEGLVDQLADERLGATIPDCAEQQLQ